MKRNHPKLWAVALGAAVVASLMILPRARGELVYEEDAQPNAAQATRVEDRGELRQALGASERAQATLQAQQPRAGQVTAVPASQAADVNTTASVSGRQGDSQEDVQNMTRAELIRRQRVREELKNEDALQVRLEELRLRDERRRTDQILGAPTDASAGDAAASATGVNMPKPLYNVQEQAVVSPVTDHPGQASIAPVPAAAAQAPAGPVLASASTASVMDQSGTGGASTATISAEGSVSDKTTISVMPRLGFGNMTGSQGYDISGRFATGVGLNVATSENVSFDLGYTYAEYGIAISPSSPTVAYFQQFNPGNTDTIAVKQNVVDAGVKLSLLGPDSKLRPFLGGGAAWAKSFINYDQQILNSLNQYGQWGAWGMNSDYTLTQYLGYLSAGLDIRMSKSMAIELLAKYYTVLSASESAPLNNSAFYSYLSPLAYQTQDKQYVSGSLERTGFYSILGGVNFVF